MSSLSLRPENSLTILKDRFVSQLHPSRFLHECDSSYEGLIFFLGGTNSHGTKQPSLDALPGEFLFMRRLAFGITRGNVSASDKHFNSARWDFVPLIGVRPSRAECVGFGETDVPGAADRRCGYRVIGND